MPSLSTHMGRTLLMNGRLWAYATERDGFTGPTTTTPTISCRVGCQEFMDYVSRRSQLERFDTNIVVVVGDLENITDVDGINIDCLAFPTSSVFCNPGIGVAGCVHRRIKKDLTAYINNTRAQGRQEVLTTPDNAEDIKLLVHCVRPSRFDLERVVKLYNVYTKALAAIEAAPGIHCVAFASISTGRLEYSKQEAAEIAMRAVQDKLRSCAWPIDKLWRLCVSTKKSSRRLQWHGKRCGVRSLRMA